MKKFNNLNLILDRMNILKDETELEFGFYNSLNMNSEDGCISIYPRLENPDLFDFCVTSGEYEDEHTLFKETINWNDIKNEDIENDDYIKYEIFKHLLYSYSSPYSEFDSHYFQLKSDKILVRKSFNLEKDYYKPARYVSKFFDLETGKEESFDNSGIVGNRIVFSKRFLGVNSRIRKELPKVGDKFLINEEIREIEEVIYDSNIFEPELRLRGIKDTKRVNPSLLHKYKDIFIRDIRYLDDYYKNIRKCK